MKKCPHCGCKKFIVTAHIGQDWMLDEDGNWCGVIQECTEVVHAPDDDDMWSCVECGYQAEGSKFNVSDEYSKPAQITLDSSELKTLGLSADASAEDITNAIHGVLENGLPF